MSRHSGVAHKEECHDIDQTNDIGALSQHLTILLRHQKRRHQMNFAATKDNYVATRNEKTMRQCAYNKVFYVATDISTKDKTKADFMSQEENYVVTQHSESTIKNTQTLSRHRIALLR